MPALLQNFKRLLATQPDNPLLHHSLGNEYFKRKQYALAEQHLRQAVTLSPDYSAAWKILGKTLSEAGALREAVNVFRQGIEVAEKQGDIQAAKEMQVFLKRAAKKQ